MPAVSEWIMYSVPDDFWPVAVLLILLSAGGFAGGLYYFLRMRVLENVPTSKIRSAAQGYLELSGQGDLLEGPAIIAPLTGTTCTWYSYLIQERRRSGRNDRWTTIEKGTSDELFLLVDETGKCVIDPDGADIIGPHSNTWYGTTAWPSRGHKSANSFLSAGRYRYTEKRMHPGDPLYAIGLYRTVGGANTEPDLNTDVIALLKEWKADSDILLNKFDANGDGKIDIQEWEAVRDAALREVMAQHHELNAAPAVNIMTRTRDRRRPYILSTEPEANLVTRFRYYSRGLTALFFIAGACVSWMINLRFYGG